jgi:putative peptidoglycan lipid II flippase
VLSIDHPSRIRVSIEGDVALAFPATMPNSAPEDDIRGIGAALYALLVDRWPLPEHGIHSGLPPADTDGAGAAVEPRAINRQIPFQISAAAARAVQPGGGISTASTLLNLLKQATAAADRTDLIEPVDEAPQPPTQPRPILTDRVTSPDRKRRNLLIGIGAGVTVLVVGLILLASVLSRIFGDVGGIKGDQLGLNPSTSQSAAANGSVVKPTQATVFSPGGGADNPDEAGQAISGGSGPGWSTDTYTDAVPFPNFKSGVGLMLQLPQPTKVGSVTLTVPSTGTAVQIRSANSPNPASLDDTTVLAPATTLQPGSNTIQVNASAPTSNLLVWISTMGTTDGKNRTELSGIVVKAAA